MINPANLGTWLTFATQLAQDYALSRGKNVRALGYLQVAVNAAAGQQFTNTELTRLMSKYQERVALDQESTAAELEQLRDEIKARSLLIQQ